MATLAEVLRQAGYVTPQGQVTGPRTDLAQKLKGYVTNVIPNALQNAANQRADIDAALTMGQGGIQIGDREAFARQMAEVPNLIGLTAYHGTPHKIVGKFDINKVGTGEGAQAYGHGMYFAENPAVAKEYQNKLSSQIGALEKFESESPDLYAARLVQHWGGESQAKNILTSNGERMPTGKRAEFLKSIETGSYKNAEKQVPQGNLYKVDIPDEYIPNMLDWDKPMNMQSPQVLKSLKIPQEAVDKYNQISNRMEELQWIRGGLDSPEWNKISEEAKQIRAKYGLHRSGEEVYRELATFAKEAGNQDFSKVAAENLKRQGIAGIRYLDEGSRGKAKNTTSNFVVFDPSSVQILEENAKPIARKELIKQEIEKLEK